MERAQHERENRGEVWQVPCAQARLSLTVIYDESRALLSNNILLFRMYRAYATEACRGV